MQNLIAKYFTKQASLSELDELTKWIEDPAHKEEFIKYAKINHAIDFNMKKYGTDKSKKLLLKFIEKEKKAHKMRQTFHIVKYAAVILIFLGIGFLIKDGYLDHTPTSIDSNTSIPVSIDHKIEVGTDKAILTL